MAVFSVINDLFLTSSSHFFLFLMAEDKEVLNHVASQCSEGPIRRSTN